MNNNPPTREEFEKLKKDLDDLVSEFYLNNFTSSKDYNKYSRFNSRIKFPVVATLPTSCEVGEACVLSTNGKLQICSAANTWTAQT